MDRKRKHGCCSNYSVPLLCLNFPRKITLSAFYVLGIFQKLEICKYNSNMSLSFGVIYVYCHKNYNQAPVDTVKGKHRSTYNFLYFNFASG